MVDPLAIKVMAEKGIDISSHKSKTIADLKSVLLHTSTHTYTHKYVLFLLDTHRTPSYKGNSF
jgi:hypothetical protein